MDFLKSTASTSGLDFCQLNCHSLGICIRIIIITYWNVRNRIEFVFVAYNQDKKLSLWVWLKLCVLFNLVQSRSYKLPLEGTAWSPYSYLTNCSLFEDYELQSEFHHTFEINEFTFVTPSMVYRKRQVD